MATSTELNYDDIDLVTIIIAALDIIFQYKI